MWVGIIAEDNVEDGIMGDLGGRIVGEQFQRLRDGDRFWYENAYPQPIINEIKRTTLEDIFSRNLGL